MPYHVLTDHEKAIAIAKLDEGWSLARVAEHIGSTKPTIQSLKKKWNQTHTLARIAGGGRKRKSTQAEDEALVTIVRDQPFTNAIKAKEESNFPASKWVARRRIKEAGLRNSAAVQKVFLTENNKRSRMDFAADFVDRNDDFWRKVVFTDENFFQSSNNCRLRVYRPRNQRFQQEYVHHCKNSGRFSVHVWGWFSSDGVGVLHVIDGRLNGPKYVEVLNDVMLPSVRQRFPDDEFIFQQVEQCITF